jgi:hypothetical protein
VLKKKIQARVEKENTTHQNDAGGREDEKSVQQKDSEVPGTTNENRLGWRRRRREKYIQQHGGHKVQNTLREICVAYKLVLVKKEGRKERRYAADGQYRLTFPVARL